MNFTYLTLMVVCFLYVSQYFQVIWATWICRNSGGSFRLSRGLSLALARHPGHWTPCVNFSVWGFPSHTDGIDLNLKPTQGQGCGNEFSGETLVCFLLDTWQKLSVVPLLRVGGRLSIPPFHSVGSSSEAQNLWDFSVLMLLPAQGLPSLSPLLCEAMKAPCWLCPQGDAGLRMILNDWTLGFLYLLSRSFPHSLASLAMHLKRKKKSVFFPNNVPYVCWGIKERLFLD